MEAKLGVRAINHVLNLLYFVFLQEKLGTWHLRRGLLQVTGHGT